MVFCTTVKEEPVDTCPEMLVDLMDTGEVSIHNKQNTRIRNILGELRRVVKIENDYHSLFLTNPFDLEELV